MPDKKRKIAKWNDIKHLVERGSLIKFIYDTEIYNLDKEFPGIYDFGAYIKDLAGNEVGAPVYYLKQPKDALHSVVSNLITRSFPEDHPEADDFKTFTGKLVHTLDRFYEYTWDKYRDEAQISVINKGHQKENQEIVRLFPVEYEDGTIGHVRLHEEGRISYEVSKQEKWNYTSKDEDGNTTYWRRLNAAAEMRGYANATADDPWIWSTLFMGGHPEIYKTHTKAENKYREDLFKATIGHILWGKKGEDGVKAGSRFHPVKEKEVVSLKQSDIIPANTRDEGKFNKRGMHLADGSDYDPDKAHGTAEDTQGTSAIEDFERDTNPEITKHFELMADPAFAREYLLKGNPHDPRGFHNHPLRAFGRYDLENGPSSHLGMCVDVDLQYGNRNNALLLKLDVDWDAITYQGKRILDIKHPSTLKKAIKETLFNKFGKQDSLIEQIHIKKTPVVFDADKAMDAGCHSEEDYNLALRNRSKIRKNKKFMHAVMEIYEENVPQSDPLQDKYLPLDDQMKDNFTGEPRYFEIPMEDGNIRKTFHPGRDKDGGIKVVDAESEIYDKALYEWNTQLSLDKCLKDVLRGHAIEWCEPADAEKELKRFLKVLKKAKTELSGSKGYNIRQNTGHLERPSIHIPDMEFKRNPPLKPDHSLRDAFHRASETFRKALPENQAEAKAYLTQLRFQALWADYNNDKSFRFHDPYAHAEIVDRDGHVMSWEAYNDLSLRERREKWENGDIDLRLHSVEGHTVRIFARMMYESGELDELILNFARLAKACDENNAGENAEKAEYKDKINCLLEHKKLYEARAAVMLHGYPHLSP
ncbi:MAG: hypothetical protein ACLFR0_09565, partial [Alphaproteobacteria bacterium]